MTKESRVLIKKALAVGDSRKQFKDLVICLKEELKPATFYENLLIDKLAIDYWRLRKLLSYEKDHILKDDQLGSLLYDKSVNQFINYQKSVEKSIENGIKAFKEAKKQREFIKFL
jgi:hypothetical protein